MGAPHRDEEEAQEEDTQGVTEVLMGKNSIKMKRELQRRKLRRGNMGTDGEEQTTFVPPLKLQSKLEKGFLIGGTEVLMGRNR